MITLRQTLLGISEELENRGASIFAKAVMDILNTPQLNEQIEDLVGEQELIQNQLEEITNITDTLAQQYQLGKGANTIIQPGALEHYFGLNKRLQILLNTAVHLTTKLEGIQNHIIPQREQILNLVQTQMLEVDKLRCRIGDIYNMIGSQCLTDQHWQLIGQAESEQAQILHDKNYKGDFCVGYYIPITAFGPKNEKLQPYLTIVHNLSSEGESKDFEVSLNITQKSPSQLAGIPCSCDDNIGDLLVELLEQQKLQLEAKEHPINLTILIQKYGDQVLYADGFLKIPVDAKDCGVDIKTFGQEIDQIIDQISDAKLIEFRTDVAQAFNCPIESLQSKIIANGNQLWLIYQRVA